MRSSLLPFLALVSLAVTPAHGGNIVPRGEWDDAIPAGGDVVRYPRGEPMRWLVVHHSDFAHAPGPAEIRDYHLAVSGFADIGYHFVIARDGTVYEGRSLAVVGAHAGATVEQRRGRWRNDPDWGAIGVVLDGNFMFARPPPAQLRALDALARRLADEHDIRAGHILTHREVRPRLVNARGLTPSSPATDCPGDALQKEVDRLRARLFVARTGGGRSLVPL